MLFFRTSNPHIQTLIKMEADHNLSDQELHFDDKKEPNNLAGMSYLRGTGGVTDYQKALECFQRSANAGNKYAYSNLANMYHEGLGVQQDGVRALELYQKSAQMGARSVYANIGRLYTKGCNNVKRDYLLAIKNFLEGAKRGCPICCRDIASMFENGRGVQTNYHHCVAWHNQASSAEQNPQIDTDYVSIDELVKSTGLSGY